jgi:hypothetical protein
MSESVSESVSSASPDLIWPVRTFVYQHFARTATPPTLDAVAQHFHLTPVQVEQIYLELDRIHAFFLEPGSLDIRIANPFSALPTGFRVESEGVHYWANCGWDSLGVAAALHADARIEAACAYSRDPLFMTIEDGQLAETDAVIHFVVPFAQWYENMAYT